MATRFKFNLGAEVKDAITGFEGVVTSRTEWTNGCKRYGVQARALHDGIPVKDQAFDEEDLVLVKPVPTAAGKKAAGGPRPDLSRPEGPARF